MQGWTVASGPCPVCWFWPSALIDPVTTLRGHEEGDIAVQPPVLVSPGIRAEFAWPHYNPRASCAPQGTMYHPICNLLASPDPSPCSFTKSSVTSITPGCL